MLRILRSIGSIGAVLALTAMAVFGHQAQASADEGKVVCNDRGQCHTEIDKGGSSGGGNTGGGAPVGGFRPGPSSCQLDGETIKCKTDLGVWNGDACYIQLADDQGSPPSGQTALDGAWYTKTCVSLASKDFGCLRGYEIEDINDDTILCAHAFSTSDWRDTPPPGIDTLTPGQAAQRLIDTFQLEGVPFTTSVAEPESGAVGLPVWLWIPEDARTPLNWGPYEKSATLGGVTVSATAKVTSVVYRMGDGGEKTCSGTGTAYNPNTRRTESPDCGYTYTQMSPAEGDEPYEIEALARWTVDWSGGGQSGSVVTYTNSTAPAYIGEIQVVNVPVG